LTAPRTSANAMSASPSMPHPRRDAAVLDLVDACAVCAPQCAASWDGDLDPRIAATPGWLLTAVVSAMDAVSEGRRCFPCLAADVILKERRKLVLVPRETPLSEIHQENMLDLARKGVQIVPPMPAFYDHPKSVNDIVDHLVVRILDQFDLPAADAKRWEGMRAAREIHTVA
jgi:hypothetical protein